MRRKCRKNGEITVMELPNVAIQTPAMMTTGTTQKKRRRFNGDGNSEFRVASSTTSMTSRSRRILVDHRQLNESQCLSPNLDPDDDMSCCSSSMESSEKRIIRLPDLEGESIEVEASTHLNFRERRETTPSSEHEDLDSTSRPSEANSRRRSTVGKMPTGAELEEFFAAAEKNVKKQFAEKYNYDIVKDEPLKGRYQWVRLNP
ncbi:Cyclin-dependent kinase inhibitor 6 [Hibiscus syriacus]|uniref:Cyclin-dependent kinase inhibitor n=1 Tax=Hibiscus syriacus TaxID=106335 RepID=A0A6A2XBK2_HIBSY|nr:cyclin-dependent kinase inhibitor 7-like isoform X2 [Hibiscus syriacus]KAE8672608.1 Cyclin-dependent kinase inhibitor 6 [Hibiscus syriacus]